MKKNRLAPLLVAALAAAAWGLPGLGSSASPVAAQNEVLRGTVTAVYDGDTVKVRLPGRGEERVRLIGVDAPELDDARERVRLMAFLAKRFTFNRLYRTKVDLLRGPEEWDTYGRRLAFVRTMDGELFNETLVREGYAFAYLRYPFDEGLRKRLKEAENAARQSGKGLWREEPYPVVTAAEAGLRLGELVTVRFRCSRSFKRSSVRVVEAEGGAFEAIIPAAVAKTFPGSLDFSGATVEATGLVELYKGRPQIMIGLPAQIQRVG